MEVWCLFEIEEHVGYHLRAIFTAEEAAKADVERRVDEAGEKYADYVRKNMMTEAWDVQN